MLYGFVVMAWLIVYDNDGKGHEIPFATIEACQMVSKRGCIETGASNAKR